MPTKKEITCRETVGGDRLAKLEAGLKEDQNNLPCWLDSTRGRDKKKKITKSNIACQGYKKFNGARVTGLKRMGQKRKLRYNKIKRKQQRRNRRCDEEPSTPQLNLGKQTRRGGKNKSFKEKSNGLPEPV